MHNTNKRKDIFEILRNRNIDRALLQETHSTPETEKVWKKEWKGESLWHSGPITKASGVAILLKENLGIDVLNISKDKNGRILKWLLSTTQEILQIINIYAPTISSEKEKFYEELLKYAENDKKTILAGDFNMVENLLFDRKGGNPTNIHQLGLQNLNKIKNTHNMIDIWRNRNPYKRIFTYHNSDNSIHSRLDRIYLSDSIKTKCQIIPTPYSDHDSVDVIIQVYGKDHRGPGIWKLNTSILQHKTFQKIIKGFWKDWQKEKTKYTNHNNWWEIGKIYIQTLAVDYCKNLNLSINKKHQTLIKQIIEEKSKLQPNTNQIEKYQQMIQDIETYKTQGTIIRSKEQIILNEEKPTKYFFLQENQKQNKKHIKIIINEQGETLQENLEILKECKNYFQKIYKKQETCEKTQDELLQNITKTITENQNTNLSREIQISEIKEAIFKMENGKSPGIDGLPIEFYKHFFETIKYDLQTTYNKSLFEHYSKPETWNQAIIALIPKNVTQNT